MEMYEDKVSGTGSNGEKFEDAVQIPQFESLDEMAQYIEENEGKENGSLEVLRLANRQHATDMKNAIRASHRRGGGKTSQMKAIIDKLIEQGYGDSPEEVLARLDEEE